LSQMK